MILTTETTEAKDIMTEEISATTRDRITLENTSEYSLQLFLLDDSNDEIITQEILEIALQHALRTYRTAGGFLFTNPKEVPLRDFQRELESKDLSYDFVFKAPAPLS